MMNDLEIQPLDDLATSDISSTSEGGNCTSPYLQYSPREHYVDIQPDASTPAGTSEIQNEYQTTLEEMVYVKKGDDSLTAHDL